MSVVAIQGLPGAFSHQAVEQVVVGPTIQPTESFDELISNVRGGHVDIGVIPVENTLAGAVPRNLERIRQSGLTVIAETTVPIQLCLMVRPGHHLVPGDRVASHPMALEQCQRRLRELGLVGTAAYDTAGAVAQLMDGTLEAEGAVASCLAARLYGAEVVERGVEDDHGNETRFFVLATGTEGARFLTGLPEGVEDVWDQSESAAAGNTKPEGKATLSFVVPHQPGSLVDVIQAFSEVDLNMTRIESWPNPGRPDEYRFFADVCGESVGQVRAGLDQLCQRRPNAQVTVMGVFPTFARKGNGTKAEGMATAGLEPATPTM